MRLYYAIFIRICVQCNISNFYSYHILGVVDHDETEALNFVTQMKTRYPTALSSFRYDYSELDELHTKILSAHIDFNSTFSSRSGTDNNVAYTTPSTSMLTTLLTKDVLTTGFQNSGRVKRAATPNNDIENTGSRINEHVDSYPIEVDLAHYFHYCSIAILAILVVEVIY